MPGESLAFAFPREPDCVWFWGGVTKRRVVVVVAPRRCAAAVVFERAVVVAPPRVVVDCVVPVPRVVAAAELARAGGWTALGGSGIASSVTVPMAGATE
jgi:hypothetical protein